jgi:hypothetical protein
MHISMHWAAICHHNVGCLLFRRVRLGVVLRAGRGAWRRGLGLGTRLTGPARNTRLTPLRCTLQPPRRDATMHDIYMHMQLPPPPSTTVHAAALRSPRLVYIRKQTTCACNINTIFPHEFSFSPLSMPLFLHTRRAFFAISFGSKMFVDGVQKHIWWMDDAYV